MVACGGGSAPVMLPDLSTPAPDMAPGPDMGPPPRTHVIVVVWDGLRSGPIDKNVTPNLALVANAGAIFQDHHAVWPPLTMPNAASLATGSFPSTSGLFATTVYAPGTTGTNARGKAADFVDPIITEDWSILHALDMKLGNLLLDGTLFQAAHAKGIATASIGMSGPTFVQDLSRQGTIVDEDMVWPMSAVQDLLGLGLALPVNTPNAYSGSLSLPMDNGNPTMFGNLVTFMDAVTPDPSAALQSRATASGAYLQSLYLQYVLTHLDPLLTVIWMRNPAGAQEDYGPGTTAANEALHADDSALGMLLGGLNDAGLGGHFDLIVMSEHGHSTVSGPPSLFPLRGITAGAVGSPSTNGFSVSGQVRLAELLSAQFPDVFDGTGCVDAPVMSGVLANGTPLHAETTDTTGAVCGTAGTKYTSKSYKITGLLPSDAVVIAPNGGADWIYVPSGSATQVQSLVTFLQSREEIGAIFVASKYGAINGTFPLNAIDAEAGSGRSPDLLVGYNWADDPIQGQAGIEFSGSGSNARGAHGAFSPHDTQAVMVAFGPDFQGTFKDSLPTSTADVAPTIARILGTPLPNTDGRPLLEALVGGNAMTGDYAVSPMIMHSTQASGLAFVLPTGTADTAAPQGLFSIDLAVKSLVYKNQTWTYFDQAQAVRK
jgi:hypothetical protein